jgi:DNA-binding NarL/FixJ family response regulator
VGVVHRVVVVEDHPIFREGVVQCLDAEPDFAVVGTWATGAIDAAAIARLAPDLVLMDVELPEVSGIEATRALREALPDIRVVMLTAYADGELLFEAMQAGAVGYLLKHVPAPELVRSLRALAAGEHVLTPDLASRFLREFRTRQTTRRPRLPQLSAREEEVLKLLATGETNRQIARRLFVSDETIKSHVAAILRKLEVSDRTSAAVIAVRAGLVEG